MTIFQYCLFSFRNMETFCRLLLLLLAGASMVVGQVSANCSCTRRRWSVLCALDEGWVGDKYMQRRETFHLQVLVTNTLNFDNIFFGAIVVLNKHH